MVRTILAALDGTAESEAVLCLGIDWARRHNALLVGMAVIDEPGLHFPEEGILGEGPHLRKINESLVQQLTRRADQILGNAAVRCSREGVAFKPLEEVGSPWLQIRLEAERYDLILIGRETHFRSGLDVHPDDTLTRIVHNAPRPVVIVPSNDCSGDAVLIAYEGSLQASRALRAFEGSGLAAGRAVHVVSIAQESAVAARHVERAIEFLSAHGITASPIVISGRTDEAPAATLLERAKDLRAGLIVMGAYGQSVLREFFMGSTTKTMLRETTVPLFVWH